MASYFAVMYRLTHSKEVAANTIKMKNMIYFGVYNHNQAFNVNVALNTFINIYISRVVCNVTKCDMKIDCPFFVPVLLLLLRLRLLLQESLFQLFYELCDCTAHNTTSTFTSVVVSFLSLRLLLLAPQRRKIKQKNRNK